METNPRQGMRDISNQIANWHGFKYADSGLVEDFKTMLPEQKERVIRAIIFHRIPGSALDKSGKVITVGGAMNAPAEGDNRFYTMKELENFSLKFLRELAEGEPHKIDITGKNAPQIAAAIFNSQKTIAEGMAAQDPTLS